MPTTVKLGPGDHGRPLTFEEFLEADYEEGWRYELIEGRLYVSPMANPSRDWIERYVHGRLDEYKTAHPDVINHVTPKCRVFVPDVPAGLTAPEPDVAAFADYPDTPPASWREVSPLLVVEVFDSDADEVGPVLTGQSGGLKPAPRRKDLRRNVDLYWKVDSIQEYWAFDLRDDPLHPVMHVFRRGRDGWITERLMEEETYTTELLPGFSLPVSPPRKNNEQ